MLFYAPYLRQRHLGFSQQSIAGGGDDWLTFAHKVRLMVHRVTGEGAMLLGRENRLLATLPAALYQK